MSPVIRKSAAYPLLYNVFLVLTMTQISRSFNLDVDAPLILRPPDQANIQFGFSLAHVINGTERRLLVGAPTANTSQVNVTSPGALYSCSLDKTPNSCTQMRVDTRNAGDKYRTWITVDHKDNQRLGYSIAADQNNIVVCAPRWHIFEDVSGRKRDLPLGMCFQAKAPSFNTFKSFSPPYLAATGYMGSAKGVNFDNNGSCQIGMSISSSMNADYIDIGSPGCWSWQGDVWTIGLEDVEDYMKYKRAAQLEFDDFSLTPSNNVVGNDVYNTLANLYLGYSIGSMTYAGLPTLVSAMPRISSSGELRVEERDLVLGPVVYLFARDMTDKLYVLDKIKPPQTEKLEASKNSMFSYFGYSLTTADVNGDGLDDVVVGAPFYHNDTHYDQGAIFVYTQNKFITVGGDSPFGFEMKVEKNSPKRMGEESYGRFGSCVAAIGDIDADGNDDIAVGAPFLEGGGAIFIYFGSTSGLEEKFRQMIRASSLPANVRPVKGFGHSIAQRLQAQEKRGFDVAVGAYETDVVTVFKTKEIIVLEWKMTFNEKMDLSKNKCYFTGANSGLYPCVTSEICLKYYRRTQIYSKQTLRFVIKLNADVDKIDKRLFFDNGNSEYEKPFLLQEDVEKCESIHILARKNIEDMFTSFIIQVEVVYQKQDADKIILDPRADLFLREKLEILIPCEGEEARLCKSDLRLQAQVMRNYTLMATDPILINFKVANHQETAFNTILEISNPGDFLESTSKTISCEYKKEKGHTECGIGVAFTNNDTIDFNLTMTPNENFLNSLQTHQKSFHVEARLSTTSEIINPGEAARNLTIPIHVVGNLDLTKDPSSPARVYYNSSESFKSPSTNIKEEELGPEIKHSYKIYNSLPYEIFKTKVTITWPLRIDGKYLLYLLDMPVFTGVRPVCNYSNGEVNEFNIRSSQQHLSNEGEFTRGPHLEEVKVDSRMSLLLSGVDSKRMQYLQFQCTFDKLSARNEVLIKLRSRLVQRTITELEIGNTLINVSSFAQVQVLQLPLGAPLPPPTPESSILTEISYQHESPKTQIPIWLYIVPVLGGLLLLAIICIILWKCGFFNRNKPEVADATDGNEEENADDREKEEEEEEDDPVTPTSPMLKETERANDDFEYRKSMKDDIP